jgi:hypothetical protein
VGERRVSEETILVYDHKTCCCSSIKYNVTEDHGFLGCDTK